MDGVVDKRALWAISYGVYIITSVKDGAMNGQTANTLIQVSGDPPHLAVAINKENYTHEFISASGLFGASVLADDAPLELIGHFGFRSGREIEKLKGREYMKSPLGVPLVTEHALSVMEASVIGSLDAATHTVFIGRVTFAKLLREGTPLTYIAYRMKKGGGTPKTAPTHREEPRTTTETTGRYRCKVCGYIYDPALGDPQNGVPPGTPFQNLPDDWVCPMCNAPKSEFERV